jgi:hypothetical protein
MLAQLVIVAASGGVVESSYTEILIATFILGQIRSPTGKTVWTMFLLGVIAAVGAQLLSGKLRHIDKNAYDQNTYGIIAHGLPLLFVGMISPIVSYYLRKQTMNASRRLKLKTSLTSPITTSNPPRAIHSSRPPISIF